jgi:hypothetical protein
VLAATAAAAPPGKAGGVLDESLEPEHAWISAGRHAGASPASRVWCAGAIWGRVIHVGEYGSCVRRVCHPLYRDVVQLAAPAEGSLRAGPRGLLKGGMPCRVELVDARQPVQRGDLVLAADEQGLFAGVLIYGSVSRARRRPGQPYWEIEVQTIEPPAWEESVWVVCAGPTARPTAPIPTPKGVQQIHSQATARETRP